MRGLITSTSQHCWENVLDTGPFWSDRGRDTAAPVPAAGRGRPVPLFRIVRQQFTGPYRRRGRRVVLHDRRSRSRHSSQCSVGSGCPQSKVTIEVAGEVPTPELRETVMRIVGAEAWRLRPDVITLDHLFIVPPVRRPSDSIASRG